jgi:lipopolysaccharide/colanic/teichoic acid biosynthesis glycosyltransferase
MDTTLHATSEFPGMFGSPRTPARAFEPVRAPARAQALAASVSTPAPGPDTDTGDEPTSGFAPRSRSELACRMLNVAVALVLIVLTLPLTVVTALLIKLTSPGPVFYSQTRVGLDRRWNRTRALYERRREDLGGEQFTILKFRSMRVDAEVAGQAVWATKDDDRVTTVGRFIRATRIDELPQLLNVLRGDMNVVGPRPERPSIFVRLREDIRLFPVRQRVKPGITGWAQINRSYDTDVAGVREKLKLDIEYLRNQSLLTDVRILLRTVPVVVFRRGGW